MKLNKGMTLDQFNNGYWYAKDLKSFVKEIGVKNYSSMRKDELEKLLKSYFKTGKIPKLKPKNINTQYPKDSDLGLAPELAVRHFTNNKETWGFLDKLASEIDPEFKRIDGTKYRLNRWRDEQLSKGKHITYNDLARAYVEINNSDQPRKRIPGSYYMYFLDDYMKNEPNATREDGIKAWHKLKKMNIPKTYADWKESAKK